MFWSPDHANIFKVGFRENIEKAVEQKAMLQISLMVYLILTKNDICLDFFQFPSTGGDIRIREGGLYVGGAEGEIKPSDPPSLFGLWGIVSGG